MSLYAKYNNNPKYGAFVKCTGCDYKLPLLVGKERISLPAYFGVAARDSILKGFTPNNCLIVAQGDNALGTLSPSSIASKPHTSGYTKWYMPYSSSSSTFKAYNGKNVTWGVNNKSTGSIPVVYVERSTIPTNYINIVQYECYSATSLPVCLDYQIVELSNTQYYSGSGIEVPFQDYDALTNNPNTAVNMHYCTIRKTTSYNYLKALFTPFETKTAVSNLVYHGVGFVFEFSNTARWTVEN